MGVPIAEQKKLWALSGNRCAFSDCRRELVSRQEGGNGPIVLGHAAHIVASSLLGPRGEADLSLEERNRYENLIFLCNIHHQLVDAQPDTYTPERLRSIKHEHETWVRDRLGAGTDLILTDPPYVDDTIYSTMLPITHMPPFVFAATSRFKTEQEIKARLGRLRPGEMAPFIVRENKVFAFQQLGAPDNPFREVIDSPIEKFRVEDWANHEDHTRWLVALLNRSLNKLTGRRGLALDKDHHRYYFPMKEPDEPVLVSYRPLNAAKATRNVVWRPTIRATGAARKHWLHLAVSMRFIHAAPRSWFLSLRPELRVTTDGLAPYPSAAVGARITKKKSRLFNYDLLGEVQFWRDYLSASKPRIVLPFGTKRQRIVISTDLMQTSVTWPGIPAEHAKPFRNVHYLDDLFAWAEVDVEGVWDDEGEVALELGSGEDVAG